MLFARYNLNDKFRDEMGIKHEWERRGMHIGYWWERQKERDH
jgi:hypothetical protein